MFNRIRRTKIVSTLGPSTDTKDILKKMIQSGSNILRLNFSHGTPEEHKNRVKLIREIIKEEGYSVALLGDLQGPKIRISSFVNKKIYLNIGDKFLLDSSIDENSGTEKKVSFSYKNLSNEVFPNDILLLDDGKIQLQVLKTKNCKIYTKVIIGGYLTNKKGLNKLGGGLSAKALTNKDKKDIKLAAKIGVDYLAVSFPRSPDDLEEARKLMRNAGSNAQIVAKIERAETVSSDDIIKKMILASDVIMIARGDLGIEIGDEKLIGIQKKIIKFSRRLNKIVITATQMMESMILNSFPTRAEVMDVANAVLDGTDAVMLSAETASGLFPVQTIQMMAKICVGAEKTPCVNISNHRLDLSFNNISETLAMSAMYAANHLKGVSAVIIFVNSLNTVLLASRITSGLPIFYFSYCKKKLNLSLLYRGVTPIYLEKKKMNINNIQDAINILKERKFLFVNNIAIVIKKDIDNIKNLNNIIKIVNII